MGASLNDLFFSMLIYNDAQKNAKHSENRIKKSVYTDIVLSGFKNILCNKRCNKIYERGCKGIYNAFDGGYIRPLLGIGRKNMNKVFISVIEKVIKEKQQQIENQNYCTSGNICRTFSEHLSAGKNLLKYIVREPHHCNA